MGAGVLKEEASQVFMLSVGFECTQHLALSLWRPVQVTGSKCWQLVPSGTFVLFPGMCLELYKPRGSYGFMAMFFL